MDIGEVFEVEHHVPDPFECILDATDDDDEPFVFDDWTCQSQIRDSAGGALLADLVVTLATGAIVVSAPTENVRHWPVGTCLTWDILLFSPSGDPVRSDTIRIATKRGITRVAS